MEYKHKLFLVVLIMFFCISFISASFSLGNRSYGIQKQYSSGDKLSGWVNISTYNEISDSLLETNFGDSISLIDFLDENNAYYSCTPSDCGKGYSASNPQTTKIINLNAGETRYIGFNFSGNIEDIYSVKLNIQSNAPTSCSNPLKVDFFNDNSTDLINQKSSNSICTIKYGCFNTNAQTTDNIVTDIPYCQRIKLSESPGFKIGAWIKKLSGSRRIVMALYDGSEAIDLTSCVLPDASITGGEISCDINYTVTQSKNYYVCLYSDSGSGDYIIKSNSYPSSFCGFNGEPIKDEDSAYQIFAISKNFANFGNVYINNSLNEEEFSYLTDQYINDKYNGKNCTKGCIVPIKLVSGTQQTLTLGNLELRYKKSSGTVIEKNFYDINESSTSIDSPIQKLYIDYANFSSPTNIGNKTLTLSLGGSTIFTDNIYIGNVGKINSISPIVTAAALTTTFFLNITKESNVNITNYEWDFGNGDVKNSNSNYLTYTFNSTGIYPIKVTVTGSNSFSMSKIFSISVVSPKEAVNYTLNKSLTDLQKIKTQINSFTPFEKSKIEDSVNVSDIEDNIKNIQKDVAIAVSDEDYTNIMFKLNDLNIPKSVYKSKSVNSITFLPNKDNINLDVISTVGGGNYTGDNQDSYINSISSWNLDNLDTKFSYDDISALYGNQTNSILKFVKFDIKEKNSLNYDSYFVIKDIENLNFEENYNDREESGYRIIKISNPEKTISFTTTEEIDISNLPVFISPEIGKLPVYIEKPPICNNNNKCDSGNGENTLNCSNDCISNLKWYLLALLIGIAIVVYLILHKWYSMRYETYLFKNRNNLFNIISYITNSKSQGITKDKIISTLKKAGWTSEQVNFAFKKYEGKKIGMPGLSFGKKLPQQSSTGNKQNYRKL